MNTKIIVQQALDQVQNFTGIKAKWTQTGPKELDGKVAFLTNGKYHETYIEIKKELRNHQLPPLLLHKKQYKRLMIVAEYIFPKIKEELRKEGIGYVETNGNIYFKQNDVLLWLDGQKGTPIEKARTGRAFTKTGLKVVFHFLVHEEWINLTYREIAEKTGVGFGNINIIMNDLKEQGFLLALNKDTYALANKKELLAKWITGYEEKLKPTLLIGAFRFLKDTNLLNWKQITLKPEKTLWGGEPAGDLLTNYLKPAELTLYTLEKRADLMKHYLLIPDNQGTIKVYQKFWTNEVDNLNIAPPLLVYIDLMITGDRRCMETAQKIYNAQLQDKF